MTDLAKKLEEAARKQHKKAEIALLSPDDKVEARYLGCILDQARARLVPEGWVAVPKKPTDVMIQAGSRGIDHYYHGTKDAPFEGSVAACYEAMLAAATTKE